MQVNFTINIDDRFVKGIKAFFKKRSVIVSIIVITISTFSLLYAAGTSDRIVFKSGDPIIASEINQNFATLWAMKSGGSIPVGTILPYVGTDAPDETWLLCDGSTYDTGDYSDLYALLNRGTTPDLRGRVMVGINDIGGSEPGGGQRLNDWADNILGTSGDHTDCEDWEYLLTDSHIPDHQHKYNEAKFSTTYSLDKGAFGPYNTDPYTFEYVDSISEESTISDPSITPDPINIVQPSIALNFIIKAKLADDSEE